MAAAQVFEDCSNYIVPAKVFIDTDLRLQEPIVSVNDIRLCTSNLGTKSANGTAFATKQPYTRKVFEMNSELSRGNHMFQFRQTTTVKKNRQETDGVDRNRFASYFFRADREIRGNAEESDNIFVIAQGLINRERNRVFENPMSIL